MSDRDKLRAVVQDAVKEQLRYMLSDPGPWIHEVGYAAGDLADRVVAALCNEGNPVEPGGWLIQHYGEPGGKIHRVIEFDMNDGGYQAFVERNYEEEDENDE